MLTCQWQRLGCELGADVPEEVEAAGFGDALPRGARAQPRRARPPARRGLVEEAPYAVSLAYRIRYVLDLNAREAMHLIELRSGREGHAELPRDRARDARPDRGGHPAVAAAMTYADRETESRLERLQGELRRHARLQAAGRWLAAEREQLAVCGLTSSGCGSCGSRGSKPCRRVAPHRAGSTPRSGGRPAGSASRAGRERARRAGEDRQLRSLDVDLEHVREVDSRSRPATRPGSACAP